MTDEKFLEIKERLSLGECYVLDGIVVDIIELLQKYVDEHGESVYLEYDAGYYDDAPEFVLRWTRLESVEERDSRVARIQPTLGRRCES